MEIPASKGVMTERLMTLLAKQGTALRLQVGQVIAAKVITVGATVSLQVGAATVQAQTKLPLAAGENLRLQVAALNPQVVLRVVPNAAQAERAVLHQGLRESLPRQLPLIQLTTTLHRLATAPGPLQAAASDALRALPEAPRAPGPAGAALVQRLLAEAGMFFENRLSRGAPEMGRDLKGMLLRLLTRLPMGGGSETERAQTQALQREAQGALSRLQSLQIQPLLREPGERVPLVIEIPVRVPDQPPQVLRFEIAEEAPEADAEQAEPGWSITLNMSMEPLGALRARVSWRDGTVGFVLAAERPHSAALLRAALPELAQRLEAQGVKVGRLECHEGLGPSPTAQGAPGRLLSTQA